MFVVNLSVILPLSGLFLITPSSGSSKAEICKQHVNKAQWSDSRQVLMQNYCNI